jgi:hypothetical protein
MEWLIALALLFALIFLFGDILLMLVVRIGMFLLMLWVACVIHGSLVKVLVESELIDDIAVANLLGFVAVLFVCCSLLRWSSGLAVAGVHKSDVQIVGLDAFRVGLIVAVGFALLITLAAVTTGKLLLVSWMWLLILAVLAAGLDVCFPSVLGGATRLFSPKITLTK